MPVERHASPALALSPGAAGREALASSWGDTSRTCVPLARGCALGKAWTWRYFDSGASEAVARGAM